MKSFLFIRKVVYLVLGLLFCGLGTALAVRANQGVSPISAPPVVMSEMFSKITYFGGALGFWTVVYNGIFIFLQMFLLGKKFTLKYWLEFPALFVFGYFVSAGMYLTQHYIPTTYVSCFVEMLLGCIAMGLGVALELYADLTFLSGDGFVSVVSNKYHLNLGKVKIIFDVGCVLIAVAISFFYLDGKIIGIREGTIVAALLVGPIINFFMKLLKKMHHIV